MMTERTEERICKNCGYEVTYRVIGRSRSPKTILQFAAVFLKGGDESRSYSAVTDNCPGCGEELTLESTSTVAI